MNVMVMPNFDKPFATECTKRVCERLQQLNICVLMSDLTQQYAVYDGVSYGEFAEQLSACDVLIAIGGDGTIIHSAKHAVHANKPILGINAGRLGFLAGLEQDELDKLDKLVDGSYQTQRRMMLEVCHVHNGLEQRYLAFNDLVVSKGSLSRMVEVDVLCDQRYVGSYRADGLIFSTPTGSTAYALSAGGPIIDPTLDSISMTPISPQSLFGRSILFAEQQHLRVCLHDEPEMNAYLTVDGEQAIEFFSDDTLLIRKSNTYVQMITLNEKAFYEVLNEKFIMRSREEMQS